MSMFGLAELLGLADDMAKARAKKDDLLNERLVNEYLQKLVSAKTDRAAFDPVFASIKADKQLKSADVIAIAHAYNKGGTKPSSKTMALASISKRFVEIVRFHAKNKVAEKARPW